MVGTAGHKGVLELPLVDEASNREGSLADPGAERRFQAVIAEAMASRDPGSIRRLYKELGVVLEGQTGQDLEGVRALSWPETAPVVSAALGPRGGLLLDAGCGPLPICATPHWAAQGLVVGVDLGLGTVRLGRAMAARSGRRLLAVVADIEALPFRSDTFDGGVCDDTIEHIPHEELALAEMSRVMRRTGLLVLATPNRRRPDVLWRRLRDRATGRRRPAEAYFAVASHLREYTWSELERLVGRHFRVVGRATVGWSGGGIRSVVSRAMSVPMAGRRLSRAVVLILVPPNSPL